MALDKAAFLAVNSSLGAGILGNVFVLITRLADWSAVWIALCAVALWHGRGDKASRRVVVLTFASLLLAEIANVLLKTAFARPRPAEVLTHVNLLLPGLSGYSFPSAHATRSFAAAYALSQYFTRWRWGLYGLAALVAFSRVAVGAHFLSDVIGGAALGMLIGWVIVKAVSRLSPERAS